MSRKTRGARKAHTSVFSALKPTRGQGVKIKPKRARVIGVFSCKGGVGKTTTVANLSMCLTQSMGDNILAVDANLTSPNLGLHFGEFTPKVTIHDALTDELPIEKAVMKSHGLQAILGSITYVGDVYLVDLRGRLAPLKSKYKVILIDSAPGVGSETIAAIKACDEIIIVTNPHIPTIASTLKTLRTAERYKVPIVGVIVNKARKNPFDLSIKDVKKLLGWPIISAVPEDPKVYESTAVGIPVVSYAPQSSAAKEFKKLGEFLIKRLRKG